MLMPLSAGPVVMPLSVGPDVTPLSVCAVLMPLSAGPAVTPLTDEPVAAVDAEGPTAFPPAAAGSLGPKFVVREVIPCGPNAAIVPKIIKSLSPAQIVILPSTLAPVIGNLRTRR